jgi:hypothetical protein
LTPLFCFFVVFHRCFRPTAHETQSPAAAGTSSANPACFFSSYKMRQGTISFVRDAGAKARHCFAAFAARLKSCPDAFCYSQSNFARGSQYFKSTCVCLAVGWRTQMSGNHEPAQPKATRLDGKSPHRRWLQSGSAEKLMPRKRQMAPPQVVAIWECKEAYAAQAADGPTAGGCNPGVQRSLCRASGGCPTAGGLLRLCRSGYYLDTAGTALPPSEAKSPIQRLGGRNP